MELIDRDYCIDVIIEGEAEGADRAAQKWAEARGCPWHEFPADWNNVTREGAIVRRTKNGKLYDAGAGFVRNAAMVQLGGPDAALETFGGNGTRDMRERLISARIPIMHLNDPYEDYECLGLGLIKKSKSSESSTSTESWKKQSLSLWDVV